MRAGERRARVREMLVRGVSPREIAARLGIAKSTVYRARSRLGMRGREGSAYALAGVRLMDRELAVLDRLVAAGAAKSRSAVLRKLVRLASDMYEPAPAETAFVAGADRHLSRLGGNFNQIAAALSASVRKIGRADPTREQVAMMHGAADEVEEIRAVLVAMLRNSQARTADLEARLLARDAGRGAGDD